MNQSSSSEFPADSTSPSHLASSTQPSDPAEVKLSDSVHTPTFAETRLIPTAPDTGIKHSEMSTHSSSKSRSTSGLTSRENNSSKGWEYKFRTALFIGWIILLCLIIAIIVTFIVQNLQNVRLSFLNWHGELPLAVSLLIALIGGATFMFIILSWKLWNLRQSHKRLGKNIP